MVYLFPAVSCRSSFFALILSYFSHSISPTHSVPFFSPACTIPLRVTRQQQKLKSNEEQKQMNKPPPKQKNRWHDKLCFCVKVVMSFAPLFSLCWYPDVVAFFFEHYYTLKYIMLCTLSCWKRLTPARMSRKWAFASERSSYANRKKKNMYKHVATDTQWVLTELNRFDKIPCQPLLAVAAVLMALKPDKYTLINTCITMRTSLHLYSYPYERRCDAIIEILQHKCSFFSLDAPLFHRHLFLLSWMWATSSLLTFGTWHPMRQIQCSCSKYK